MIDDTTIDQAVDHADKPQSIQDRIGAKFGFPAKDQAATEETPAAVPSDVAELEWDGERFTVPVKLKDAFMRNEDYTKKTQELAEQRRAVDQLREISQTKQMDAVFGESVQAEQLQIAMIDAYLNSQVGKLDPTTMTTDDIIRKKIEIDNLKEQREGLKAVVADKRSQFQTSIKSKIDELRGKSRELAAKSIQGFSEQTEGEMRKFALAEGLAEPEIDNVLLDPRSYKIIWKAMQFDRVQAGTVKADTAVKALKPGAASTRVPQEAIDKNRFTNAMAKATTSAEKARIIEQRLMGTFAKGK
jgi:hypothetical protein